MKLVYLIPILLVGFLPTAFGEIQQINNDDVKLDIQLELESSKDIAKLKIDFINPSTNKIQVHIDYRVELKDNHGNTVFGPIPLTHTSTGSVTIPVDLNNNEIGKAVVDVEGILFRPIEKATVIFDVNNNGGNDSENNVSVDTENEDELTISEYQEDDLPESKPEATQKEDTTGPNIVVPKNIHVKAKIDTPVTFSIKAIDDVDGLLQVECDKISGQLFSLGETRVHCSAEDSGGNRSTESFFVFVGFETVNIPDWVKQVAQFWMNDQVDDSSFIQMIEYLIKNDIITVPIANQSQVSEKETEVPSWIKSNTEFWVNGKITDDDFALGLEWLINNGIIKS